MSAPIVYEGVHASNGDGGGLFKSIKFWIAQRVPSRTRFISDVKANGGEVVPLEKQADILIADHARKDAPLGSYSWKFIEECVQKGILVDKDPFSIHQNAPVARPVGSSRPVRIARNAFTPSEDELLTKWVLYKQSQGEASSGNVIYQKWAEKYPRHTWQSWRDRWCKIVQFRPRREYTIEELEPPPSPPASPAQPPAPPPMIASQSQPSTPARSEQPSPAPSHVMVSRPQQTSAYKVRVKFTAEDDALLVKYVQEKENEGYYAKGNKIYVELAEKYPHHTFQSWRDRYIRHLQPSQDYEPEDIKANDTPQRTPSNHSAVGTSPSIALKSKTRPQVTLRQGQTALLSGEAVARSSPNVGSRSTTSQAATLRRGQIARLSEVSATQQSRGSTGSPASLEIQREIQQRALKQEQARRLREAAKTLQRVWRGRLARQRVAALRREANQVDSIPENAGEESESAAVWETAQTHQEEKEPAESSEESDMFIDAQHGEAALAQRNTSETSDRSRVSKVQPPRTMKEQFLADFQDYRECTDKTIDLWPRISDRFVELWDLYEAVMTATEDTDQSRWQRAAETLGFDWIQHPSVAQEVAQCYEDNLAEFVKMQAEFDDSEEIAEDKSRYSDAEEDIPEEGVPIPVDRTASETPLPSSPPRVGGLKRHFEMTVAHSDVAYSAEPPRKRARVDRGREIPSTPEHEASSLTPARRRALESSGRMVPDDDQSSQQLPSHPQPAKKRVLEPATQDFRYGSYVVVEDDELEADMVTPSQQLRSELNIVTDPIPLALPKSGASSKSSAGGRVQGPVEDTRKKSSSRPESWSSLPPVEKIAPKPRRNLPPSFTTQQSTLRPRSSQPVAPVPSQPPSRTPPEEPRSSGSRLTAAALEICQSQISKPPLKRRSAPEPPPASTRSRDGAPNPVVLSDLSSPGIDDDVEDNDNDDDDNSLELRAMVEHYMSLGYPQHVVMQAMRSTMGGPKALTGLVMESLLKGDGIPANYEGVWTVRDDKALSRLGTIDWGRRPRTEEEKQRWRRAEQARGKLVEKHGEARIEERKAFLRYYESD